MVAEAKERGISRCIVPAANRREAGLIADMQVYGARSVGEVIRLLTGGWSETEDYNIEETAMEKGTAGFCGYPRTAPFKAGV